MKKYFAVLFNFPYSEKNPGKVIQDEVERLSREGKLPPNVTYTFGLLTEDGEEMQYVATNYHSSTMFHGICTIKCTYPGAKYLTKFNDEQDFLINEMRILTDELSFNLAMLMKYH